VILIFNLNFYNQKSDSMKKRLTMFMALLLLSVGAAMAQTKVSGTVVAADAADEPVTGAVSESRVRNRPLR
jgi:hypothetical protein